MAYTASGANQPDLSRKIVRYGIMAFVLVVGFIMSFSIVENNNADEIMVIQAPFSGTLSWYTDAGMKMQLFGKVTVYNKRSQFWFSDKDDQGAELDQSIKVRFNDGGHGNISGSIAWEMPTDVEHLTMIHTKYGSQKAVEQQLVRTVVEKSVYMTGPLMSS